MKDISIGSVDYHKINQMPSAQKSLVKCIKLSKEDLKKGRALRLQIEKGPSYDGRTMHDRWVELARLKRFNVWKKHAGTSERKRHCAAHPEVARPSASWKRGLELKFMSNMKRPLSRLLPSHVLSQKTKTRRSLSLVKELELLKFLKKDYWSSSSFEELEWDLDVV